MSLPFDNPEANNPPPPLVSKSAFADELGLSKARVSQLVDMGLPLSPDGKRVRRAEALTWYQENIAPHRRKALADKPSADPRRELDRIKAEAAALDLEKARGNMVARRTVERVVFERARMERDAHLGWISRVASELAAELGADPAATFAALDRMMRDHLAQLAETPLDVLADD